MTVCACVHFFLQELHFPDLHSKRQNEQSSDVKPCVCVRRIPRMGHVLDTPATVSAP